MERSRATNSRAAALILLVALLVQSACDAFDHDDNSPEPSTLDHHEHVAILHFRTINHSADTFGIVSATTFNGALEARRDAGGKLSRNNAVPGSFESPVQIVYPDSESHACTLAVEHFVGYQGQYGGDTTRLSSMDRYGTWTLQLYTIGTRVAFANGETLVIDNAPVPEIPDTVRYDRPYELDITVDLDGLLVWREALGRYALQPSRFEVRQR